MPIKRYPIIKASSIQGTWRKRRIGMRILLSILLPLSSASISSFRFPFLLSFSLYLVHLIFTFFSNLLPSSSSSYPSPVSLVFFLYNSTATVVVNVYGITRRNTRTSDVRGKKEKDTARSDKNNNGEGNTTELLIF